MGDERGGLEVEIKMAFHVQHFQLILIAYVIMASFTHIAYVLSHNFYM